jgi:small subunit ribosomal protein S16
MLTIRLRRAGKKKQPFYRLVVAENSAPVLGKFIQILGYWDPLKKKVHFEKDLVLDWLNKGARPSNTVAKIFKKEGVEHKLIIIKKFRKVSAKELEEKKAEEEAERAKREADKIANKEAWEKEAQEKAEEAPSSDEKLIEQTEEEKAEEKSKDKSEVKEEKPQEEASTKDKAPPDQKEEKPPEDETPKDE